jgi:hypothetical protein
MASQTAMLAPETDTDEPVVRTGTPEDVHGLMELAMLGADENGLTRPDPQKILQDIWSSLNLEHGICGVIGQPPHLEGMVVLRVGSLYYSDEPALEEKIIYVRPEFRSAKGGRANKLCRFSMEAADRLHLPLIIGILSTIRTEAKVKMYSRLLGPPSGAFWIYGRKTGEWQNHAAEASG